MIGEIQVGLSILDRLGKLWKLFHTKKSPPTVATRFVRLLESHGVHRNQIPRFVGHGLTLKDVQDDVSLLSKLDESILQEVCERFAVRREWLDGAESQIYSCHDFYKYPKNISTFIETLIANNPTAELNGVLIAPKELRQHADALLILQEAIGFVGDKPIYRYHFCNNWSYEYWKARAYLTACIAIAWKHKAYVHGVYMPKKSIDRLAEGDALLDWKNEGIWELGPWSWHPEDMALLPDAYLKDIDPEQDNFGIKSALTLWIHLAHEGMMDTGFKDPPLDLFQQELARF